MADGAEIIVQGAFQTGRWVGRTDVLRRVDVPSDLGTWSYEVIDTKLARETKGGTVLQLCLYADLVEAVQGKRPEFSYVVAPWSDYVPQRFRMDDYAAFFRHARRTLEVVVDTQSADSLYPEPKEHCDICRWQARCEKRRRADDHLCLVANISGQHTAELQRQGITTVSALASMPLPLTWKPDRGAGLAYPRLREQARIQVAGREAEQVLHELLPVVPGFGLALLPEPSPGDIFFDLEGDPFAGEGGLEYLFGYAFAGANGTLGCTADWALSRADEKAAFERFVDFVTARLQEFPDLHIYHFAPYEPAALKRLMGRYATREEEIDQLLRGKRFIDLYSVVRNGLRASLESYSIKKLEALYGFTRSVSLPDANLALAKVQAGLELGDLDLIGVAERSRRRIQSGRLRLHGGAAGLARSSARNPHRTRHCNRAPGRVGGRSGRGRQRLAGADQRAHRSAHIGRARRRPGANTGTTGTLAARANSGLASPGRESPVVGEFPARGARGRRPA